MTALIRPDAAKLRHLRQQRGKSLVALGDLAGISHMTIGRLERGENGCRPFTLACIAGALGVTLEDLMPWTDQVTLDRGDLERRVTAGISGAVATGAYPVTGAMQRHLVLAVVKRLNEPGCDPITEPLASRP